MREIKFRAWDKKGQIGMINTPDLNVVLEDERYAVMQYTGLKDKNEKEIYEGDIVRTEIDYLDYLKVYTIGFENGTFCFLENDEKVEVWDDGTHDWHSIENIFSMKVIGNIYENLEMI